MSRVAVTGVLDAGAVQDLLVPRDEFVAEDRAESADGRYAFTLADGPLRRYQRTVRVTTAADGQFTVRQEVTFAVGVPWFSWLFVLPLRRHFRRLGGMRDMPWWAPPQRLDRRAAVVLATLCALMVVGGYLDNVLTQTMTYAGADFHVGTTGQGVAFGVVEVSAVLALLALVAADRRGRRSLILGCAVAGALLTAVGASTPSLSSLTVTQVAASSFVGAFYLLLFVLVTEEMPAGSRAWAAGVLSLCYSLGAGGVLLALPLAGESAGGWRWVYAIALAGIPIVARCARDLPESRRFVPAPARGPRPHRTRRLRDLSPEHRRRLWVLAAFALAYALFVSPAGEFHNQFLRTERHFSSVRISLLHQFAGTLGGVGVLVGGRLADTRGRRPVAAIGIAVGTAITVASFLAHGWPLWAWAVVGSLISFAVGPALAVYGPELFPTSVRSRASGALTIAGAAGGIAGLVATGALSSSIGTIGPALAILSVGPLVAVLLIVVAFPETARRPLEELNPEDALGRPGERPRTMP